MNSVVLFYEKCRLCLDKAGISNIFEIENLSNDIFNCIGVKVLSTDNLPQKICLKCFETVENAKELRLLAMRNDSHLKSLIASDDEDDDPVILTQHPNDIFIASCSNDNLETVRKKSTNEAKERRINRHKSTEVDKKPEISIRKDLYENSGVVTSSTKSEKAIIEDTSKKRKIKTENEDLECAECGKQFGTRKKLYIHKRQHSKSIACPLDACGKMFATKGDLRRHLRIHTGDKPYSCDMCDKKFTQNVTLKNHKETIHGLSSIPR